MAYIPLNRIKTNLYTVGNEYQLLSTGKPYTGFYWKRYDNKIFTGKNPDQQPQEELIVIPKYPVLSPDDTLVYVSSSLSDFKTYSNLIQADITSTRKFPQQYTPQPTESDYSLGSFIRYFLVKINENNYLEVNKDTYSKIKAENQELVWELYESFELVWTLIGEKNVVYNTNGNIVLLTEQRIKRQGLQSFLRNNYLKFYRET